MKRLKLGYMTSAEVANHLGFSADHVRKMIVQGKIKAEKLGRNWIIDKTNLNEVKRKRFPKHP